MLNCLVYATDALDLVTSEALHRYSAAHFCRLTSCDADVVAEQGVLPHLPHPLLCFIKPSAFELRPEQVKWDSYRPEPLMSQPGGLLTIVRPYPKPSPTCIMPPMRVPSSKITMPTCEMNCPRHHPDVRDRQLKDPESIV